MKKIESLAMPKFNGSTLNSKQMNGVTGGETYRQCQEATNYSQGRDIYRETTDDNNRLLSYVTQYYNDECY